MLEYKEFLKQKTHEGIDSGISVNKLNPMLYRFQHDVVKWALKIGKCNIFADCGLGKTPMQLEWANKVPGKVLILAPLAVSQQTIKEGEKFGIKVKYSRKQATSEKITITNYEMLDHFDSSKYQGIVLDESSILKSYTGKYRNQIIESFRDTPYKLACTATPAPNDFMELGNHVEFMGVMTREEMLSMFFVHDCSETQKWRLKGHAEEAFWKWLCTFSVMLRKPSDLGYEDDGFVLPSLNIIEHIAKVDRNHSKGDMLFRLDAGSLSERIKERRITTNERVKKAASIINQTDDTWLIWCNLNNESELLTNMIDGAAEVKGSDSLDKKTERLMSFSSGKIKRLVTKPKIAGFGMNWQHCSKIAFVGLSDSYEQFYQAVRRCWRFGQTKEVDCHIITAETEGAIVSNIKRKEKDSMLMAKEMVKHMQVHNKENLCTKKRKQSYRTTKTKGANWTAIHGDSVLETQKIETETIDYTIFSPPFASLYTYSDSERDMGNCKNESEFKVHFNYLIKDLYRITKPGRLVSFHCMNIPTSLTKHGQIGIKDFRGDLIRMFQSVGFIYHSEVCIWKNPVVAMQRTKALGLLHKQLVKDSAMARQGIPDYVVTMRKPGANKKPIAGELSYFVGAEETFTRTGRLSIDIWQRYASPIWTDINQSNTLQYRSARANKDEKHICPLQLDVIERCLQLWSNPDDLIFSPFMGIGSEGYIALKIGRRFVGIELKKSYYEQAHKNLKRMETEAQKGKLFE